MYVFIPHSHAFYQVIARIAAKLGAKYAITDMQVNCAVTQFRVVTSRCYALIDIFLNKIYIFVRSPDLFYLFTAGVDVVFTFT
jgi:hypothetical protein